MATRTTKYNLAKPEMTDLVTPAQFNENFDIIDAAMTNRNGDTFVGNMVAYETARTTRGLFNEETRSGGIDGTLQSVKYFINVIDATE